MNCLPIKPSNIPDALKAVPHWLVWRGEERDGKLTKVPYNARTGTKASVTGKETWSTFEQALKAYESGRWSGIGLVLTQELGIVGIDIDHCYTEEEGFSPLADTIIGEIGSYTEFSPSGTGIRIFAYGTKPAGRCKDTGRGVEVYDAGRYLTITGNSLYDLPIRNTQEEIDTLHQWLFPPTEGKAQQKRTAQVPVNLDDQTLIQKMLDSKSQKAGSLWRGEWQGYFRSASEADLSLCMTLAFWTAGDLDRIDRLFRQSGLMRDKWDEKHGKATYGQITLEKAVTKCTNHYEPTHQTPHKEELEKILTGERDEEPETDETEPQIFTAVKISNLKNGTFSQKNDSENSLNRDTWAKRGRLLRKQKTEFDAAWSWAVGEWYKAEVSGLAYGEKQSIAEGIFGQMLPTVRQYASMVSSWERDSMKPSPGMTKNIMVELGKAEKSLKEEYCQKWERGEKFTAETIRQIRSLQTEPKEGKDGEGTTFNNGTLDAEIKKELKRIESLLKSCDPELALRRLKTFGEGLEATIHTNGAGKWQKAPPEPTTPQEIHPPECDHIYAYENLDPPEVKPLLLEREESSESALEVENEEAQCDLLTLEEYQYLEQELPIPLELKEENLLLLKRIQTQHPTPSEKPYLYARQKQDLLRHYDLTRDVMAGEPFAVVRSRLYSGVPSQ